MDSYQKATNKIINDIMSNNNSAVMLFAPAGSGKTDFLMELSQRYQTVYWYNALSDGAEIFGECLAQKVFPEPELLNQARQVMYCGGENGEAILIAAILQHIASLKSNCLLVMERMDTLPDGFDISLIERLIKHCPKNLKIVISSNTFLNFDYTKFEPVYPVLIDELILSNPKFMLKPADYTRDLNKEALAFLAYVAELEDVDTDFAVSFYPKGKEILQHLAIKDRYVADRDGRYFRFSTPFRQWLTKIRGELGEAYDEFAKIPLFSRYAEFFLESKNYFEAFRLFYFTGNKEGMNRAVKKILETKIQINMLKSYCYFNADRMADDISDWEKGECDFQYYGLYLACGATFAGDINKTIEIAEKLLPYFSETNKNMLYYAYELLVASYIDLDNPDKAYELYETALELSGGNPEIFGNVFCRVNDLCKAMKVSPDFKLIKPVENYLEQKDYSSALWYPKVIETVALAYFDAGKQRNAMSMLIELKKALPLYVIPYKMLDRYYYSGDIEGTKTLVDEAFRYAEKNEVMGDFSYLYSALAKIDMYYGKIDSALELYDKAVAFDKDDNERKFYNIMQRCNAYSKAGKFNYSKEIAHIYLKYSEKYAKDYTHYMLCALAYCFARQGNKPQANYYATQAVKASYTRSSPWAVSMGIAIEYLLERGDLKDAPNLIRNLLRTCDNYNLNMAILEAFEVFEPILLYAEQNDIMTDYVRILYAMRKRKENEKQVSKNLRIRLFGTTAVYSGDKEIQWKTKKAKELFLHYILAGKEGIDRNVIIDYLWKDYVYESAINNLKTTNNIIRKTLAAYNVNFELQYINSKYILVIDEVMNDYEEFKYLLETFNENSTVNEKVNTMNKLLEKYREGFAIEFTCVDFIRHRAFIMQEMSTALLKLVLLLKEKAMFVEAKRYLTVLLQVEKKNDYRNLMEEIVEQIV